MALTPRLDLRQTQSLVMTPQLQQAIKLLQLSNIELTAYVEQELERNPLLEREGEGERDAPGDEAPEAPDGAAPRGEEPVLDAAVPGQTEAPLDVDYDNLWNGEAAFADWSRRGGRHDFDDADGGLDEMVAREQTLREHLIGQLNVDILDPADRLIGLHLIDQLDDAGYLACALADVAEILGCDAAQVERVLARLQRFDPPGVFARNLAECLACSCANATASTRRCRPCSTTCPAGQTRPAGADARVRGGRRGPCRNDRRGQEPGPQAGARLRPCGGAAGDARRPDASGRQRGLGDRTEQRNTARVLVDTHYYARVSGGARSREEKSYLTERFQSANWLVKALHQRATTILKVASEIVRQQEMFFAKGVRHLRPLILRDIAQAIGMHESTVSRVTANKFMATPRGIFELKYFFTQAIAGADGGEAHSAEAVRHRIKTLIDGEGPKEILSDDRIVEMLKEEGIEIARRTVAKYREAMNIPSSVQRRREKALGM